MVVLILSFTASSQALESPERMVRTMFRAASSCLLSESGERVDAFAPSALRGGRVGFVLERRPPGALDWIVLAFPRGAGFPGIAPYGRAEPCRARPWPRTGYGTCPGLEEQAEGALPVASLVHPDGAQTVEQAGALFDAQVVGRPLVHPHIGKPRQRHRNPIPHHTNWRRLEYFLGTLLTS